MCCGKKSPATIKSKLATEPLVYSTMEPPKNGKCSICKNRGQSFVTVSEGMQVRVWVCRKGHVAPPR